jgi:DNA-directed RNA polymerase beta subunit
MKNEISKRKFKLKSLYLAEKRIIQVGDKIATEIKELSQYFTCSRYALSTRWNPVRFSIKPLGVPSRMNVILNVF